MPYSDIENGIRNVLTRAADYSCTNVVANDERVLATGPARAVNISYGSLDVDELTIRVVRHVWNVNVDLYVRWPGEMSSMGSNLITERQALLNVAEQWPRLNATTGVVSAVLTPVGEPEPMDIARGAYRRQRMTYRVEELVEPSRQE